VRTQTTDEIKGVPPLRALFRQAGLDGVVSSDLFADKKTNRRSAVMTGPVFDFVRFSCPVWAP
jgi:hypothetical protein